MMFLFLTIFINECNHRKASSQTPESCSLDRIALIAYREKRRWLLTWASIYALSSFILTSFTHYKGPDSHEWYGCTLPLSFWALFLFLTTLSYYTTDYMQQGALEHERGEKYVYDPKVGPILCFFLGQCLNKPEQLW